MTGVATRGGGNGELTRAGGGRGGGTAGAGAATGALAAAAGGFLLRDFSRQPGLTECLRITIGSRGENDRLLAALERA